MGINDIIIYLMLIFMVLGALDKIFGNKFGLGDKFDEGFMAMGPLSIAMLGIISIAPVLADVLGSIIVPVFSILGADPAMFAGTILANDMGGYPLAMSMALDEQSGKFAGLILGSMMGPTIVFTIPVALGIINKKDNQFLASGVMLGIITIPLGCIAGGLVAGFGIEMIIMNLIPILIFSTILVAGLYFKPNMMISGFAKFGKLLIILITIITVILVIETLTSVIIIPGMTPIWEGIKIVGSIAIILIGAFPMVAVITRVLEKPLLKVGDKLGMNAAAGAGLIATLANAIPMLNLVKVMNDKGKIMNIAFAVSAAFVFGDHLGFTAGVQRDMIFPVIVGKLVGGITALLLAYKIGDKFLVKEKI